MYVCIYIYIYIYTQYMDMTKASKLSTSKHFQRDRENSFFFTVVVDMLLV